MKRLKNIAYFIIILALFLLFSSCQDNSVKNISTEIGLDDGTGILAENNAVDFYFYYPENFILQRNDAMIMVYANDGEVLQTDIRESESDEYFPMMTKPNLSATVFSLPDGKFETVEEYWRDFAVPSFDEIFQDVKSESDEDLTVDGVSAKKYTYSLSLSGMEYKISQVIFINKRRVYALTYTASAQKYETYATVLDTAAETFKFR